MSTLDRNTPAAVSVVIPAFNAMGSLAETLASAQGQTYPNLEIIVVDDGSTDNTAEFVRAAARQDGRVRLEQQPRGGVAAARNRGLSQARGDWIAPLDADDVWLPEKIEKQVAAFKAGSQQLGLVYTWTRLVDETGRTVRELRERSEGDVFIQLLLHNLVGHGSGPLISARSLAEVGGYDPSFHAAGAQGCEDWDLYLRIARRFEFAMVPECLVTYRQLRGAMSKQQRRMERSYRLMWQKLRREVPGLPGSLRRWAWSIFYDALALQARQDGAFQWGLWCWFNSCFFNPLRLTEARSCRILAGLLLGRHPRSTAVVLKGDSAEEWVEPRFPALYARLEERLINNARSWWTKNGSHHALESVSMP